MRFISDDASAPADPTLGAPGSQSVRILGAGFSRCATSSLQAALESPAIGCGPCQHMARIAPHASRLAAMNRAMQLRTRSMGATNAGGIGEADPHREERLKILADLNRGYGAIVDTVGWLFADDLMDLYPDAAIVLNKRKGGGVAWRKSMAGTVDYLSTTFYAVAGFLWATDRLSHKCGLLIAQVCEERFGGKVSYLDPAIYDLHYEWVRKEAAKRGRKVVEWFPEDGWKPLCDVVGKEVPKQEPFPRKNETRELQLILTIVTVRGLLTWALLGGGIWAAWHNGIQGGLFSRLLARCKDFVS